MTKTKKPKAAKVDRDEAIVVNGPTARKKPAKTPPVSVPAYPAVLGPVAGRVPDGHVVITVTAGEAA